MSPSVVLGEHISAPRVMCWFAPASTPRARPMPVRRLLQSPYTPIAPERGARTPSAHAQHATLVVTLACSQMRKVATTIAHATIGRYVCGSNVGMVFVGGRAITIQRLRASPRAKAKKKPHGSLSRPQAPQTSIFHCQVAFRG